MNLAKTFANDSFDSITRHSGADVSLGDGQAQSRVAELIISAQQGQVSVTRLGWTGEHPLELGRLQQPLLPGKSPGKHNSSGFALHGEAFAALGTASVDDLATAAGSHSGTKTVRPRAF